MRSLKLSLRNYILIHITRPLFSIQGLTLPPSPVSIFYEDDLGVQEFFVYKKQLRRSLPNSEKYSRLNKNNGDYLDGFSIIFNNDDNKVFYHHHGKGYLKSAPVLPYETLRKAIWSFKTCYDFCKHHNWCSFKDVYDGLGFKQVMIQSIFNDNYELLYDCGTHWGNDHGIVRHKSLKGLPSTIINEFRTRELCVKHLGKYIIKYRKRLCIYETKDGYYSINRAGVVKLTDFVVQSVCKLDDYKLELKINDHYILVKYSASSDIIPDSNVKQLRYLGYYYNISWRMSRNFIEYWKSDKINTHENYWKSVDVKKDVINIQGELF